MTQHLVGCGRVLTRCSSVISLHIDSLINKLHKLSIISNPRLVRKQSSLATSKNRCLQLSTPSEQLTQSPLRLLQSRPSREHTTTRACSTRRDNSDTVGSEADQATTHFGYTTVPENEKVEKVYEVFKKVAETYDLMNDVMSMGIHRLWKDEFVHQLSPRDGMKLIDVAGGTGDIAFRYMKYCAGSNDKREVTVCDINEHMLNVGERRALQQGLSQGVTWQQGNAECLPVESNSYDAYTIAFGIRNCTNIKKVLAEAYRVLKPGGRFMCLEFSEVTNPLLRGVYDQYSFEVIPVLGHVIAQDWTSYQYLVESIRKFPNQSTYAEWIEEAGFSSVTFQNLTFGIAAIHSGFKL